MIAALAFVQNAWTAFSPLAAVAGLGGVAALVLALVGLSWLPGFLKLPLVALGVVLLAGAAVYQAGTAKGAHDAFARDAARALAAEKTRTVIARDISDRIALQAVRDVSAAHADAQKLKDLNDANRTFALKSDVTLIEADTKSLRRDVDKHSDQIGWVVKTVGAATPVALVGLLIAKGGVPHP